MTPLFLLNEKNELVQSIISRMATRKVLFYLFSLSGATFAGLLLRRLYGYVKREYQNYQEGNIRMVVTDDLTCSICMDAPRTIILKPCKHMVMCSKCFRQLQCQQCPICKTDIQDHIQVYIS